VLGKVFAGVVAVIGSAALTLGTMVALVEGTIVLLTIENFPLRVVAILADVLLGTVALVACIYLATHLTVRIMGVGQAEFPPLPDQAQDDLSPTSVIPISEAR
jgi:hypothetical protein